VVELAGITCLPRQDGNRNGLIAAYEDHLSEGWNVLSRYPSVWCSLEFPINLYLGSSRGGCPSYSLADSPLQ
jgi:hypothetical protein